MDLKPALDFKGKKYFLSISVLSASFFLVSDIGCGAAAAFSIQIYSALQNPFLLHLFSKISSSNPQIFYILFTYFFIFQSVHGRLKPLLWGFLISLLKKIFCINEFCNGLILQNFYSKRALMIRLQNWIPKLFLKVLFLKAECSGLPLF